MQSKAEIQDGSAIVALAGTATAFLALFMTLAIV